MSGFKLGEPKVFKTYFYVKIDIISWFRIQSGRRKGYINIQNTESDLFKNRFFFLSFFIGSIQNIRIHNVILQILRSWRE